MRCAAAVLRSVAASVSSTPSARRSPTSVVGGSRLDQLGRRTGVLLPHPAAASATSERERAQPVAAHRGPPAPRGRADDAPRPARCRRGRGGGRRERAGVSARTSAGVESRRVSAGASAASTSRRPVPVREAMAHERADDLVRLAERHAALDEGVGDVGGEEQAVGRRRHARRSRSAARGSIAARTSRQLAQRGGGVEEQRLVLLEVAVVGERQALQRGEQRDQRADRRGRSAAHQLGHVGVLLLRHHRAAGGEGVGQHR